MSVHGMGFTSLMSDSPISNPSPAAANQLKVNQTPQWIKQGLNKKKFSAQACRLALRGEQVPEALGLTVTKLCVIRGIRLYEDFAKELRDASHQFNRALNARSIMSNKIPEMHTPEVFPYCIWYPDVATEDTYRRLANQYPAMKYLVGRACAVAGYSDLYKELKLLPEVHIAEEARDSGQITIYDSIVSHKLMYSCMDDYERCTAPDAPKPASLNGDTAVRSLLKIRQPFTQPSKGRDDGFESLFHYFDICEDLNIDDNPDPGLSPFSLPTVRPRLDHVVELLSSKSPLPENLPTVHKDLLILMAAYNGDVDRYSRLRRPSVIANEFNCMIHGIYHSQPFADWCSQQDHSHMTDPFIDDGFSSPWRMRAAIVARCVMSDDLSCIDAGTRRVPYQIWFPDLAKADTYVRLARHRPDMRLQCARACIVGDYQDAFDLIGPEPDHYLMCEAEHSPNPYYAAYIQRKADEGGGDAPSRIRGGNVSRLDSWKEIPIKFYTGERWDPNDDGSLEVGPWSVVSGGVVDDMQRPIYDGIDVDVHRVERAIEAYLHS